MSLYRLNMPHEPIEREEVNTEQVQQLIQGDERAFRFVYEAYGQRLYYFARKLNLGAEDSEEIVQETFMRLWMTRETIDPTIPLGGLIITIARNLIYNALKKAAVRRQYQAIISFDDEPTGEIGSSELRTLIQKAMDEMPEKRRQVFQLSRLEGYLNQHIADELGISKSTVENHLNKALKFLRKRLRQYGYGILLALVLSFF